MGVNSKGPNGPTTAQLPVTSDAIPSEPQRRKRKAHTKSRRGCGNCKLRKVKCDETKPSCIKCSSFGVSCNYGPVSALRCKDLQTSFGFHGIFQVQPSPLPAVSNSDTMLAAVSGSINRGQQKPSVELWGHVNLQDQYCAYPMYRVTLKDLDIVHRFSSRTALCLGDSRTRWIYKAESSKLVCHYAFLFHAALALTMFHDRILEFSPPAPPSRKELLHRLHGARLLKEKLSGDLVLTPAERDALWIAAVILGVSTIATIEANTPDEAWPLQRPSPSDLDWLGMADGKREIWRICDVSGPDSALQSLLHLADDGPRFGPVELGSMLENLPAAVLRLLHLEPGLTQNHAASPYYQMAEAVNRLMPVPCTQDTLMLFLSFLNEMPRSSRRLLRLKDPGAILLLAYWFAMVSHCQHWWTWRRSVLECQSICIYLERNHSDIPDLQDAIAFPKQACGPASGRDKDGSAAGSSATQTTVAHPAVVPAA